MDQISLFDREMAQPLAAKLRPGTLEEYADEIGADGYSKDAADAVKLTKRLLQMGK